MGCVAEPRDGADGGDEQRLRMAAWRLRWSCPQGKAVRATGLAATTTSRLGSGLRKEVVLHIAVGFVSARTVVAARVSRTHGKAVEAVRERCAQIWEARAGEVAYDF